MCAPLICQPLQEDASAPAADLAAGHIAKTMEAYLSSGPGVFRIIHRSYKLSISFEAPVKIITTINRLD